MSKKKSEILEHEDAVIIEPATITTEPKTDLSVQFLEIQKTYGDNLPYQRERVVNETRFFMNQSAESMLETGKRLILIKEHESHGSFIQIIENDLNLSKRTAQAMMKAAVKFLNLKNSKAQALALLGTTKLFELMTQDSDDLEELAEGGTVAGLTLDDISKMTTRELAAALRESKEALNKERERIESLERISADKSKKIDDLDAKLQKKEKADRKIELERDPNTEIIEAYKSGWLDISKQLQASMYDVKTILAKSQQEDALPHHFYQQIAIELNDVRNQINELMILLPSDITPDLDDSFLDDISND